MVIVLLLRLIFRPTSYVRINIILPFWWSVLCPYLSFQYLLSMILRVHSSFYASNTLTHSKSHWYPQSISPTTVQWYSSSPQYFITLRLNVSPSIFFVNISESFVLPGIQWIFKIPFYLSWRKNNWSVSILLVLNTALQLFDRPTAPLLYISNIKEVFNFNPSYSKNVLAYSISCAHDTPVFVSASVILINNIFCMVIFNAIWVY